jgi:hypothetical protein
VTRLAAARPQPARPCPSERAQTAEGLREAAAHLVRGDLPPDTWRSY